MYRYIPQTTCCKFTVYAVTMDTLYHNIYTTYVLYTIYTRLIDERRVTFPDWSELFSDSALARLLIQVAWKELAEPNQAIS